MATNLYIALPADHPDLIRRYRLPSDQGIEAEDMRLRRRAERGSSALLLALQRVSA